MAEYNPGMFGLEINKIVLNVHFYITTPGYFVMFVR